MGAVKFCHLHDNRRGRHVTIARQIVNDEPLPPGVSCYVRYAVAVCMPGETFSKARGREIAQGRLERSETEAFQAECPESLSPLHAVLLDIIYPSTALCVPGAARRLVAARIKEMELVGNDEWGGESVPF